MGSEVISGSSRCQLRVGILVIPAMCDGSVYECAMDVPNTGIATEVTLAAKRATTSASNGNGCGVIIGLILLVLTLGWPLFAFHRHWNTYQTVSCSADPDPIGDGCTYDWSTGDYTGTATETTAHTAISATGWIVERCGWA